MSIPELPNSQRKTRRTRRSVAPGDARRWLGEFEAGKSVAAIAREEERDPRTVSRAIRSLQADVETREVRRHALRSALAHHFESLLVPLSDMKARAEDSGTPAFVPLLPLDSKPQRLEPYGFRLGWGPDDEPQTSYEAEGSTVWEMLESHLEKHPIWKQINAWRNAAEELAQLQYGLLIKLESAVKSITGYDVRRDGGDGIEKAGLRALYDAAVGEAAGERTSLKSAVSKLKPKDTGMWIGDRLLVQGQGDHPGAAERLRTELTGESFGSLINALRQATDETREKGRYLAREIEYAVAVPYLGGECRACKKLGL